jgi:hypothetical protein
LFSGDKDLAIKSANYTELSHCADNLCTRSCFGKGKPGQERNPFIVLWSQPQQLLSTFIFIDY